MSFSMPGFPVYMWDLRLPTMAVLHSTMPPPGTPPPPTPSGGSPPVDVSGLDPKAAAKVIAEANAARAMSAPPYWHIDGPHFARWLVPIASRMTPRCEGDGQKFGQAGHDSGFLIPHFFTYPNVLLGVIIAFSSCRWLMPVSHVSLGGAPAAFSNPVTGPYLTCGEPMSRPGFALIPCQRTVQFSISLEQWIAGLEQIFIAMTFDAVASAIFGPASARFGKARQVAYRGWHRVAKWKLYGRALRAKLEDGFFKSATYGLAFGGSVSAPLSMITLDLADGKMKVITWEFDFGYPDEAKQTLKKIFIKRFITAVALEENSQTFDEYTESVVHDAPELSDS